MHVVLINGSPHPKGSTYTALAQVAAALEKQGVETKHFHIGDQPVRGCTGCRHCAKTGSQRCVFQEDKANALIEGIIAADGVVVGSPVYYAGPNGALCALLDRVFYAGAGQFAGKPGAAVLVCRRGGMESAQDRLNKYFTISRMPVVASQYWNGVYGAGPEDVLQDQEGLQIMRTLGDNMAWMLRCIREAGVPQPQPEPRLRTNFIR